MSTSVYTARTNYVKVADMSALVNTLTNTGILIEPARETSTEKGKHCLLAPNGFATVTFDGGTEEADGIDFDAELHVMPYIEVGEVLVIQEVGNESMRWVCGYANAYLRVEDGSVKNWVISLDDIYEQAALAFQNERINLPITEASY